MKPTMKLRWYTTHYDDMQRDHDSPVVSGPWKHQKSVLQQWWYQPCPEVEPECCDGEWRDIPIEVGE